MKRRLLLSLLLLPFTISAQGPWINSRTGLDQVTEYNSQQSFLVACADGGFISSGMLYNSPNNTELIHKTDASGTTSWTIEALLPNGFSSAALLPTEDSGFVLIHDRYIVSHDSIVLMFTKYDKNGIQSGNSVTWYRRTRQWAEIACLMRSDGNILVCVMEQQTSSTFKGITLLLFDPDFNFLQHNHYRIQSIDDFDVRSRQYMLDAQDNLYVAGGYAIHSAAPAAWIAPGILHFNSQLQLVRNSYFYSPWLLMMPTTAVIDANGRVTIIGITGWPNSQSLVSLVQTDTALNFVSYKMFYSSVNGGYFDTYSRHFAALDNAGTLHVIGSRLVFPLSSDTTKYVRYLQFDGNHNLLSASMYRGANVKGLIAGNNSVTTEFRATENFWSSHTIMLNTDNPLLVPCFGSTQPIDSVVSATLTRMTMPFAAFPDSIMRLYPVQAAPLNNLVTLAGENFCLTAGTNELGADLRINVFPNPVSGALHIECGLTGILNIIDLHGRTVVRQAFSQRQYLETGTWGAGVYFVQITSNNGISVTQKVLVE